VEGEMCMEGMWKVGGDGRPAISTY